MKVQVNLRDSEWKKSLASCIALFAVGIFATIGAFAMQSYVATIVGLIGAALFGCATVLLLNPKLHISMQVVKDEMSFQQLRDAIAGEDFEEPFHSLKEFEGRYTPLLVSDTWLVVGDKNNATTPVYIPKSKVASIVLRRRGTDKCWEPGTAYERPRRGFYILAFTCSDGKEYESGPITPYDYEKILAFLTSDFPHTPWRV